MSRHAIAFVLLLPAPAAAHDLRATVAPKAAVVEVVAAFDTDEPAEGARAGVADAAGTAVAAGVCDARGVWTFPRPPAGHYVLTVELTGHRDRVEFDIVGGEDSAGLHPPLAEPATYRTARPDRRVGLWVGVGLLLGGSAVWRLLRRERGKAG